MFAFLTATNQKSHLVAPRLESVLTEVSANLDSGTEYLVVVSGDSENARDVDPFTGRNAVAGTTGPYSLIGELDSIVNDRPWHNADEPRDVDRDGFIIAFDAIQVINWLNSVGPGPLPEPDDNTSPPPFLDVDGDNSASALDALLIINWLNALAGAAPAAVATEIRGDGDSVKANNRSTMKASHETSLIASAIDQAFFEDEKKVGTHKR